MSEVVATYIHTKDDTHFFSPIHKKELEEFLKNRSKEIMSIQITQNMTVEEYNKYVRND